LFWPLNLLRKHGAVNQGRRGRRATSADIDSDSNAPPSSQLLEQKTCWEADFETHHHDLDARMIGGYLRIMQLPRAD
jgi:hypothetical protein